MDRLGILHRDETEFLLYFITDTFTKQLKSLETFADPLLFKTDGQIEVPLRLILENEGWTVCPPCTGSDRVTSQGRRADVTSRVLLVHWVRPGWSEREPYLYTQDPLSSGDRNDILRHSYPNDHQ